MSSNHESHVIGGYKSTISNPHTSEEAKSHARQALVELEGKSSIGDDEHAHRVAGGYKAAMHNPNVSKEAKHHAAEVLKKL